MATIEGATPAGAAAPAASGVQGGVQGGVRGGVIRDGMHCTFDVPIPMDDGVVLRADVYRPPGDGPWPVLLTYGPYAKGLAFLEGYPSAWQRMVAEHPDVASGSSNRYQNWEVVDPEKWVPDGYAVVRVDGRGTGRSPGVVDPWSPRETRDFHDCIEWAGVQPWSSGTTGRRIASRNSCGIGIATSPGRTGCPSDGAGCGKRAGWARSAGDRRRAPSTG